MIEIEIIYSSLCFNFLGVKIVYLRNYPIINLKNKIIMKMLHKLHHYFTFWIYKCNFNLNKNNHKHANTKNANFQQIHFHDMTNKTIMKKYINKKNTYQLLLFCRFGILGLHQTPYTSASVPLVYPHLHHFHHWRKSLDKMPAK